MIHRPDIALPPQEQCWPFRLARALSCVAPRGKGAIPRLVGRLARPWFRHAFVTRHGALIPLLPGALDVFVAMNRQQDSYDYWVFRAANALLEPDGVFFDVGANVGYLSVEVAHLRRRDGVRVCAFEPRPEMAGNLRHAASLNGFDSLEVIEAAVGDRRGRVAFAGRGNSFVGSVARDGEDGSYEVDSVTVDDVVAGGGVRPPDVLKIDVEGYEYRVLAGARRVLSDHQPAVIFEVSPGTLGYGFRPAMLVDLLLEAGDYRFYTVKCAPLAREDIEAMAGKQGDILAIPPRRQARFEWFATELRAGRVDALWQQGSGPGSGRMRVLHVVPTYLPATRYGGPIWSVHGLCRALVADGHDVHVFTTSVDGDADSDVPLGVPVRLDGVQVWYFPSRWLRRLYWSRPMMRALKARLAQFDVVHLHSVFLWPTWAAARVARARRVPYILSPRGMLVRDLIRRRSRWLKSAWIGLIERRNLREAAAIHVTSKREREDLEELGLALTRVAVIPNGVDVPDAPARLDLAPELEAALAREPCALYLGRLSWKKGLDRLIRAWKDVASGHLVIVGNDGENLAPRLRALVDEYGLAERVTLVPRHIGDAEKQVLFRRVRVMVLASYSENFGNVVLEAMAAGCPVVVTPEVGAAEVIRAAKGGLVVREDDLPAAIERLLGDTAESVEMGSKARVHVLEHYTWSRVSRQVEEMYFSAQNNSQRRDAFASSTAEKAC